MVYNEACPYVMGFLAVAVEREVEGVEKEGQGEGDEEG